MWWSRAAWGLLALAAGCGESRSHTSDAPDGTASGGDGGKSSGGAGATAGKREDGGSVANGGMGGSHAGSGNGATGGTPSSGGATDPAGSGGASAQGGSAGHAVTAGQAGVAGIAQTGGTGDVGAAGEGGEAPLLIELRVEGYDGGSHVAAISADGTYVTGDAETLEVTHAVRWQDATPTLLDAEDDWKGERGIAISADGSVIGGVYGPSGGGYAAILWHGNAAEPLPGGGGFSEVVALSADGNVAAGWAYDEKSQRFPAIWTNDALAELPSPDDYAGSTPAALDRDGTLIVGTGMRNGDYAGVRWTGTVVEGLDEPTLALVDVSDDGQWLLGLHQSTDGTIERASLRFGPNGVETLPPPSTGWTCTAKAMNGDGSTVVGSCIASEDGTLHQFLWNETRGSVTLESLLDELGIDGSVYESWEIRDISSDGTSVLAQCVKDGEELGVRVRIDSVFP